MRNEPAANAHPGTMLWRTGLLRPLIRVAVSILLAALTLLSEKWVGRHSIMLSWPVFFAVVPLRGILEPLESYFQPYDWAPYFPFFWGYYYLWLHPLSEADPAKRTKKLIVFAGLLGIVAVLYWVFFLRLDFD